MRFFCLWFTEQLDPVHCGRRHGLLFLFLRIGFWWARANRLCPAPAPGGRGSASLLLCFRCYSSECKSPGGKIFFGLQTEKSRGRKACFSFFRCMESSDPPEVKIFMANFCVFIIDKDKLSWYTVSNRTLNALIAPSWREPTWGLRLPDAMTIWKTYELGKCFSKN